MRNLVWLAAFTSVLFAPIVQAQETDGTSTAQAVSPQLEQRANDIIAWLQGEKQPAEIFAPVFLNAVPESALESMNAQMEAQFGPILGVERIEAVSDTRATVYLRFEKAIGSGPMVLVPTEPFLIGGLQLTSFEALDDSAEKVAEDLAALPGVASVWFGPLEGGEAIFAHNSDPQMPIGSTFKLYILSALTKQIAEGTHSWDEVVPLTAKSFPSGRLQTWPQGTPMTLQTLATMMISISDNTATDQLLRVVGREAVEAEMRASGHAAPELTTPFLSTFEMFALKGSLSNAEKYIAADTATRRFILADLADDTGSDPANIDPPTFSNPTLIEELEWFGGTQDVRRIFQRIVGYDDPTALAVMGVNTSLPASISNDYAYVGYKGGSEPGVLNLSWLLRDEVGEYRVLVMSWKDTEAPLDSSTFELLSQRILALD